MSKYTYFPRDAKLSEYSDTLNKTFWTAEEVDYSNDRVIMTYLENIVTSNRDEKIGEIMVNPVLAKNIILFVKNILCLFAQLDGVVIENLLEHFTTEISMGEKEIKDFYIAQAHNELIHSQSYSTQVEILIEDKEEKEAIYTASLKYPAVQDITSWTFKWFDTSLPIVERLIAFCCIEGIVFTSGFVAIYRLKEWGMFVEGLCNANEFISKDEAVHTAAGIAFFHHKVNKGQFTRPSQERVYEIVEDAVNLAHRFTDEAVQPELIGLERKDMKEYICLSADMILKDLGYQPKYNAKCPFEWMQKICLFNISNMFETRVTDYSRTNAVNEDDISDGEW